jgi:CRISPR-associated protein Cas2
MTQSEYRAVWLFAMFDLPVNSQRARKQYARFRKELLAEGFTMLQYSVYARYCDNEEASIAHCNSLRSKLPCDGQVRLLSITDRQFARQTVYHGKKLLSPEAPPQQLLLF